MRYFNPDKPWKFGHQLHPEDQKLVLSMFVHRYTKEHVPDWSRKPMSNGQKPKPHFNSDAEWLSNTKFQIKKDGRLAKTSTCQSYPTLLK